MQGGEGAFVGSGGGNGLILACLGSEPIRAWVEL